MKANLLKRIFCKHNWRLTRWHWVHSPSQNDKYYMETEYRCMNCGKMKYEYPPSDIWVYFSPNKFVKEDEKWQHLKK